MDDGNEVDKLLTVAPEPAFSPRRQHFEEIDRIRESSSTTSQPREYKYCPVTFGEKTTADVKSEGAGSGERCTCIDCAAITNESVLREL